MTQNLELGDGARSVPSKVTSKLAAGAASRDITPEGPQWLDGFGARVSPSEGAYQSISVNGLALRCAGGEVLLVAAEVLALDRSRTRQLKERISAATGLSPSDIVLSATHTHCAPRVCDMVMPGELDPVYLRQFEQACVEVAVEARSSLSDAAMSYSQARDRLGVNRRHPVTGGVEMRPYPPGSRDADIDTLWFRHSGSGEPLASLTIAACHPTCRGGQLVGGDYPGFLRRELEKRVGGVAMFMLGCAGDVRPAFIDPQGRFRMAELEEVERAGREMADAVISAAAAEKACPVDEVKVIRAWIEIPLEVPPTEEELRRVAQEDASPLRRQWAVGLLGKKAIPRFVHFELQRLSLPPSVEALFLPGEVASEYALWLKGLASARLGRPLLVAAYANGAVGYVPSQAMLPMGGYEVNGSHFYYNLPAPYAGDLEERLRKAVCELMEITTDGTEAGSIY